jgi:hypothetical protein
MNRPTFEETVSVLVKAYLNDTLVHGDDCCCAVGNLICHSMNLNPKSNWGPHWYNYFKLEWESKEAQNYAYEEIKSTGYSVDEILLIESYFENADGDDEQSYMFNGLMSVVDVLAEIHGVNLEVKESAKLQFVKI